MTPMELCPALSLGQAPQMAQGHSGPLNPTPASATHRPVGGQEGPPHRAVEQDDVLVLAGVNHLVLQGLPDMVNIQRVSSTAQYSSVQCIVFNRNAGGLKSLQFRNPTCCVPPCACILCATLRGRVHWTSNATRALLTLPSSCPKILIRWPPMLLSCCPLMLAPCSSHADPPMLLTQPKVPQSKHSLAWRTKRTLAGVSGRLCVSAVSVPCGASAPRHLLVTSSATQPPAASRLIAQLWCYIALAVCKSWAVRPATGLFCPQLTPHSRSMASTSCCASQLGRRPTPRVPPLLPPVPKRVMPRVFTHLLYDDHIIAAVTSGHALLQEVHQVGLVLRVGVAVHIHHQSVRIACPAAQHQPACVPC